MRVHYRTLLMTVCLSFFYTSLGESSGPRELRRSSYTIESPSTTYTIIKKLGEGYFSKVFIAENSQGERCALKAYKRDKQDVEGPFLETLKDMNREYQLGILLDHPDIIKPIEYFLDSSDDADYIGYIAMNLVEGDTVRAVERGAYSQQRSLMLATQLLDVFCYAHSLGLVYLDLHSKNIMLEEEGDIKIIDVASFFTYEELKEFLVDDESSTDYTVFESTAVESDQKAYSRGRDQIVSPSARKEALRKFFEYNRELADSIKKDLQSERIELMRKGTGADNVSSQYNTAAVRKHLEPVYVKRISDMARLLVSKSRGMKSEKVEAFARIMSIAWAFEEGVATDEDIVIDEYFRQMYSSIEQLVIESSEEQ